MTQLVDLSLRSTEGEVAGVLRIACRPGRAAWNGTPLIEHPDDPLEADVQLLEESEYTFAVLGVDTDTVVLEPQELFDASTAAGTEGRLKPKRSTGTVTVVAHDGVGDELGRCEFEVRSRKLNYRTEYRDMLSRIAGEAAEALQSSFAPSSLPAFTPEAIGDAQTLYQRFAFLTTFLQSTDFVVATQGIQRRPHHQFVLEHDETAGAAGIRADRHLARQLTAPGPRVRLPGESRIAGLSTLPARLLRIEHVETFDTPPNRFVKYAFEHWRNLAESVERALSSGKDTPTKRRGLREARAVVEQMTEALRHPLFAEVGVLVEMPSSNMVLQRRAGYRDVYAAFLKSEAAAALSWDGAQDVFSAGQRDVAALYEYWCFLELARLIRELPGFDVSTRPLFKVTGDEMKLVLRQGRQEVLKASAVYRGKQVAIELWFNRSFSRHDPSYTSWSEPMRPDCSVRLRVQGQGEPASDTWLHFDAKYRVDRYQEIFTSDPTAEAAGEVEQSSSAAPMSDDMLKMHAYRDAIRRSAGAYVLYPGSDEQPTQREMFHEVLPGLGAFVLRPSDDGTAADVGADALQQFILDVIDHVAAEGTDFDRATYWTDKTYMERAGCRLTGTPAVAPAADTTVLLGYVRDRAHREWIRARRLYNLRADERRGQVTLGSPELSADLVVLYSSDDEELEVYASTGGLQIKTRAELAALGYPRPRGQLYACLELGERVEIEHLDVPTPASVRLLARQGIDRGSWGAPVVTTWIRLATLAGSTEGP